MTEAARGLDGLPGRRYDGCIVVRKQIWAHHPEKLWPEIDVEWQREEMPREQAGQSDLPSRPA